MAKRVPNPRGTGEQLREELISVATALLEQPQVVASPSLRQIAIATGIAPSAVYTRFDSGEQLLQAVIDSQYKSLREEIRSAAATATTAFVKLEFVVVKYIEWGIARPGAYQLLFESSDKLPEGVVAQGPGVELLGELAVLVREHMNVSMPSAQRVTLRIWAAIHGLTSLRIHKKNAAWTTSVAEEARATVEAFAGP